jgi:hypothetical protein
LLELPPLLARKGGAVGWSFKAAGVGRRDPRVGLYDEGRPMAGLLGGARKPED